VSWIYVPRTAHHWKHKIRRAAEAALAEAGLGVIPRPVPAAFALGLSFRFARPNDHYRTGRYAGQLKPRAWGLRHTGTPDLDNLIKAAQDALGPFDDRPALIWCDDAQVVRYVGGTEKRYVREDEAPGLTVVIWGI